jgi:hypothetical protein
VTLPALILLGVLVGSLRAGPSHRNASSGPPARGPGRGPGPGPGLRALALAAVTLTLCAIALSSSLPSIAAGRASAAVVGASDASTASLRSALNDARLANTLDPVSDAGLKAEASIALHFAGGIELSRDYLLQAVGVDPTDEQAWESLAGLDVELHAYRAAIAAAQRLVELDPHGVGALYEATTDVQRVNLLEAPASASATAAATP